MGTINITEYSRLPHVQGELAPMLPGNKRASKTYTSTTTSAAADAPDADTIFQRVSVIEAHYVEVGAAATANSTLMTAGSTEYFRTKSALNFRSVA